ncbi:MAG: caspase family protein, partial [Proteobacteria bacterium]|nr:caspase family protein [Pseudomonadota bacterium]
MQRLCLLLVLFFSMATAAFAAADNRVALVIGNGKYTDLPRLPNAQSDAKLMEKALSAAGFKIVSVIDGDRQQMVRALKSLTEALTPETNLVVYYAGHGIQFADENYLIPTDSQLTSSSDLPLEAFSLKMITEQIERARPRIAVFIVDACRNN